MQFKATTTYPGTLSDVLDVLLSSELADARAEKMGAELDHTREDLSATTAGHIKPEELPDAARRFVKKPVAVSVAQSWTTDGSGATGTFDVSTGGLPASITITQTLTEQDGVTHSAITGDVNVRIPLIGGTIEKKAVSHLQAILNRDTALVAKLLGSK